MQFSLGWCGRCSAPGTLCFVVLEVCKFRYRDVVQSHIWGGRYVLDIASEMMASYARYIACAR